ncbi:MAG: NTP transferase domain-containing protein [Fimbriimonadaceae bacterium]|nr:NTP transferase domain-containing protein [Fimbriimonadaceae bacterium]
MGDHVSTEQLSQNTVKAVVMAGGEGSRLRPITLNLPKPLVPIANRPIMGHIINLLKEHGITEIVTTLHYLADEIQNVFGDGCEYGVSITHSLEDTPLGTAGAVKQAEALLKDGTFVIISGDALTDCNLTNALKFHREKGSLATLVLSRVPNPLEFGIVMTQPDGRVERFLEKPGWGEVFSDTVNTGIYILEPEIFDYIEPHTNTDWSKDVFPRLLEEGKPMYGFIMQKYWCDVGTLEQYREAQEDFLAGKTTLSVPGELTAPGIWVGENTIIDETVTLESPVCIGSNVRIKRGATIGPGTVIGDSCLIEEGANVERSVIWDRCYVGNDVHIHGAIVGSRVTLKRDSRLQDGSVVGDRCLVDVGSTIRPRVKIWPEKSIDRGSTVTMSLVTGNRWRGALFRELGVAGLSNIEITPEFATRLGLAFGSMLPENSLVLACRDSSRSSRMIKRSLMAALLSAGCQVVDMHGQAVPVLRHALKNSEAVSAINVRKFPGNNRLSLIEFYDENGGYLPRNTERKVEAAFFREDFHRADPESLGIIEEANQVVEAYTRDFMANLPQFNMERRPRIVVDYGYSSVSGILPAILGRVGIDAISINSFNDARSAPRRPSEIQDHTTNLQQIVASVGCDLGVLILNEGENIAIVDDQGIALSGNTLFAAMCQLVAQTQPSGSIVMGITAPTRLEDLLKKQGISVERCRSGVRELIQGAQNADVAFAGNENGGFIFPRLHSGFDGLFSITMLVKLLQMEGLKMSELVAQLPEFHLASDTIPCPWESKGAAMRKLAEDKTINRKVEYLDGLRFYDDDSWVLVLPDSFEPIFHVVAESPSLVDSQALVREYSEKITQLQAESS